MITRCLIISYLTTRLRITCYLTLDLREIRDALHGVPHHGKQAKPVRSHLLIAIIYHNILKERIDRPAKFAKGLHHTKQLFRRGRRNAKLNDLGKRIM